MNKFHWKILDHGYATLIETWGSDERIIEAARMSTDGGFKGWGPIKKHRAGCDAWPEAAEQAYSHCNCPEGPGDERLLGFLWRNRHSTPFEMAGMSIEVQAPLFVFREWHRHRTQSYSELSARYTQMPDIHYVPTLERLKLTSDKNKQAQGIKPLADDFSLRTWLVHAEELQRKVYEHYELGLTFGIPKEIARLNTPVARYSRMRASANLLNWLRFLGLRCAPDAQCEIREYANAVGRMVEANFPRTWALSQEKPI